MWAIVKADKVISVHASIPSELFTGDKRYDQKHLSSLSEKEKQEIGLYPVTMGGEPDNKFHTVSSVQYSFSNKKVIQSFSSKDKSLDILKDYSEKIKIKILKSKIPGVFPSINLGLQNVSGDIIFILHADNFLDNEKVFEKIVREFLDKSV